MTVYIEIGIVIFMAFLLLSLLVTSVTELIASFLKLRAAFLKKALADIISDKDLREKFYDNGLLLGIRTDTAGAEGKIPSKWTHPSYLASRAFARALLLAVSESDGQSKPLAEQPLTSIRDTVDKIKSKPMKRLLLGLIDDTSKTATDVETEIAAWYDSAMERLSGYFKREQQIISFFVGLTLAAAFNIDVVALASDMHNDNAVLAQLVASAEAYVAAQSVMGAEADPVEEIRNLSEELEGIALGWPHGVSAAAVVHVPGWILAAWASTLGAPFWFDLLSRFVQIRGTGRKPQTAEMSEKL